MLAVSNLLSFFHTKLGRRMFQPDIHTVRLELLQHQLGDIHIFLRQQALAHFHLGHLAAEAGKGMSQLGANRAAAQHQQTLGLLFQLPQVIGRQRRHVFQAGNRGYRRLAAGGDNDAAGGQASGAAIVVSDFKLPGRHKAGFAGNAVHTQLAVTFWGVVGLHFRDNILDPVHDVLE